MAVTRWEENKRWGEVDSQNFRTYNREFTLYTNNPQDGPIVVSAAIPLQLWVSHYSVPGEADPYAKLKALKVEPIANEMYLWKMTATYDNRPFDQYAIANPTGSSVPDFAGSPTSPSSPSPPGGQAPQARPWSLKFGARQTEKFIMKDRNDKPACASNGQPFEGGLKVPVSVPFFTLTCYTAEPNWMKVSTFANAVNTTEFFGFQVGWLRCTDYQITSQYEDQYGYYYEKQITCEIDYDGWKLKVLDAGTHTYFPTTSQGPGGWRAIKDAFGQDVSTPVPLNGLGEPLAFPANPVYLDFDVYPTRNYNLLI
jgi:hypothetical protein